MLLLLACNEAVTGGGGGANWGGGGGVKPGGVLPLWMTPAVAGGTGTGAVAGDSGVRLKLGALAECCSGIKSGGGGGGSIFGGGGIATGLL